MVPGASVAVVAVCLGDWLGVGVFIHPLSDPLWVTVSLLSSDRAWGASGESELLKFPCPPVSPPLQFSGAVWGF